MRSIVIVTEQLSDAALAAAMPAKGVSVVSISQAAGWVATVGEAPTSRGFHSTARFTPRHRIELAVEDDAVQAVFDGIDFAYGAGLFSDAEVWAGAPVLALSA